MARITHQSTEHFVNLNIHVDVLKQLLHSKALYLEDVHCANSSSKAQLRRLLTQSILRPEKR